MTSEGRPYARFRRALGEPSIAVIRSAAAELDRIELEDGLAICLAFLELEPDTFPRAATRWVARFALERRLTLAESQLALAALDGLGARHRLERSEAIVGAWLDRKGLGD